LNYRKHKKYWKFFEMSGTFAKRGALVFKGDKPKVPPYKAPGTKTKFRTESSSSDSTKPETIMGEGRIVSSGTTIQGMETRFKEQIAISDTLVVRHPQSLLIEERIVTSVMSQRSLTIHSPFSSDFVSTTEYSVRKDSVHFGPRKDDTVKKEEQLEHESGEVSASATDALQDQLRKRLENEENILTYREKVGMSYKTVSVKVDNNLSKEDLLNLQIKKSHDRYC